MSAAARWAGRARGHLERHADAWLAGGLAALTLLARAHAFDEHVTWLRRRIGDPAVVTGLYLRGGAVFISAAVLGSHLFFQSEKSYNGGHYVNLMNAKYDRVGIGVWVSGGRVRLVVDFYHPA